MIYSLLKGINDNFFKKHQQFLISIEQSFIPLEGIFRRIFDVL